MHSRLALLLILNVASACTPTVSAAYRRSRDDHSTPSDEGCQSCEVSITVQPDPLDLSCNRRALQGCHVQLELAIRSRVTYALQLSELRIPCPLESADSCRGSELVYSFSHTDLPPGFLGKWSLDVQMNEGVDHLTLVFTRPFGPDPKPARVSVLARDPVHQRELADCRRCRGVFEPTRYNGLYCNCATTDAGAFCRRGRDCEGVCIPTRFEVIRSEGDFEWLRPVGKCSERKALWSCRFELPYHELMEPLRRRKGSDAPLQLPEVCD